MTASTATSVVKLSSLRADSEKQKNGDWVDSGSLPGVAYLVRSTNFPPYQIAVNSARMRFQRKYGVKPVPDDVFCETHGRLIVEHVLLGWRGIDTPYTAEVGIDTLTDPGFQNILGDVMACASRVGESEIEFADELAKNSEAPSATPLPEAAPTVS